MKRNDRKSAMGLQILLHPGKTGGAGSYNPAAGLRTVVAILTFLLLSTLQVTSCGGASKNTDSKKAASAVPVRVARVERKDLYNMLELTGDIKPWKTVEVVPNIGGKVARIYVDAGDTVRQGEILAELDTESARLQLKQAEAGLLIAEANFHDAELNWKRMQNLQEKGSVSEQQYEKIKLAYEAATAQLKQAKATLDLAKYQLEVSIMKAPFDGIIASRNLNEGETINPMMMMQGSKGVVTLIDIKKVKIKVGVPDRFIKHIEYDLPVFLKVDSYPEKTFEAEIHTISPAANPLSRAFDVEIAADNEEMLLKPGMFARVRIALEKREGVLAIPVDALLKEGSSTYVFVAKDSTAVKKKIETGIRQGAMIEVTKGLKENELVVTFGKKRLQNGAAVVINGGE